MMRLVTLAFALLGAAVLPARATTYTVDRTDDSAGATACTGAANDCSLRGAIIAANANPGADEVDVPDGTYMLSIVGRGEDAAATGDLDVADDLSIVHVGTGSIIVDGGGIDRVFHVAPAGQAITVTITGLTIQNGSSIVISGILSDGGAIRNGTSGPGHDNVGGTLVLDHVVVENNSCERDGGGIANAGTITIVDSIVTGNTAGSNGGGITQEDNGVMTLLRTTVSGNQAGQGGGIFSGYFSITTSPDVHVTDSTVSGNMSPSTGGIFYNRGSLTVTDTTVSGNQSNGVLVFPTNGTFNNCTIAGNAATGLSGPGTISNTILADNAGADCDGTVTSAGYNLIESTAFCTITGDTTGNVTGQDPKLGLLQDNGGPTFTRAIPLDSPALDAGNPATPGSGGAACEIADQTGTMRPQPAGGICDIGAYELVYVPSTTTTSTTSSTSSSSALPTTTSTSSSTSTSTSSSTSSSSAPPTTSTPVPTTSAPVPTTTAAPTTSTTIQVGGCDGVPTGATFASIGCRLRALLEHVNAEDGLGSFQAKLAHSVDKAQGNVGGAASLCGDSNLKKTKKRLQQAGTALTQYAHRLRGHAARKQLDPGLQQTFLDEAQPISDDLKSLRKNVQCPADAAG